MQNDCFLAILCGINLKFNGSPSVH